jgi:hypothetical protein
VIHNLYIALNNRINDSYGELALKNGNALQIRVTPKEDKPYYSMVEFRPEWKDWKFKQ